MSASVREVETTRFQALEERQKVVDLISRYGIMADEKGFDDARSCFTEDVVAEYPLGNAEGVDVLAHYGRLALGAFEVTHHVFTNLLVDLDGDRGKVRANLIATHVHRADDPESHYTVGGFYDYEVVRTDVGWRISRLRLTEVWTSGTRLPTP